MSFESPWCFKNGLEEVFQFAFLLEGQFPPFFSFILAVDSACISSFFGRDCFSYVSAVLGGEIFSPHFKTSKLRMMSIKETEKFHKNNNEEERGKIQLTINDKTEDFNK